MKLSTRKSSNTSLQSAESENAWKGIQSIPDNRHASNPTPTFESNRQESVQLKEMKEMTHNCPRTVAQRQAFAEAFGDSNPSPKSNSTGMPDMLKTGLESYSGMDLSDVKVHYNSSKPAQLQALAYAQGNEIHLGPGQEKHLPHEGWHVVQQRQGRVKPTLQKKGGMYINDNDGLEKEADVMGQRAAVEGTKKIVAKPEVVKKVKLSRLTTGPKNLKQFKIEEKANGKWYSDVTEMEYETEAEAKKAEAFAEADEGWTRMKYYLALRGIHKSGQSIPAENIGADDIKGNNNAGAAPLKDGVSGISTVEASASILGAAASTSGVPATPADEKGTDAKAKYFFTCRTVGKRAAPFQLATVQFDGDYDIRAYTPQIVAYANDCNELEEIPVIEFRLYDAAFKKGIFAYESKARKNLQSKFKGEFDIIFSLLRDETMSPTPLTGDPDKADPSIEFVRALLAEMKDDIDMSKWKKEGWQKVIPGLTQAPKDTIKDKGLTNKLAALDKPKNKMIEGDMMVPVEEALEYLEKPMDAKEISMHHRLMDLLITTKKEKEKTQPVGSTPARKTRRNSTVSPHTLTLTNLVTGKDDQTLQSTLAACNAAFQKGTSQIYLIIEGTQDDVKTRAGMQIAALKEKQYKVEVVNDVNLTALGPAQQSGVALSENMRGGTLPLRVKIRVTRKEGADLKDPIPKVVPAALPAATAAAESF